MDDTTPLGEVKRWVWERAKGDGVHCPCCGQMAKVYARHIDSGMARSLILMWRAARFDWQHIPTTVGPTRSRQEGKLAYWDLITEAGDITREDGGRAGWWRVTQKGETFVRGKLWVPYTAYVYSGKKDKVLRIEGKPWGIKDALGKKFDYEELMGEAFEEDPPKEPPQTLWSDI